MIRLSRARLAQFLTALAVLIGALTFSSGAAQAASVNGAFSGVVVTSTSGTGPIYPWEQVKVTANWAVPDHTPAGSTFSLSWPAAQLKGLGGTMSLANPVDGKTVATCVLGAASLDCTLTDYVTSHPLKIGGQVWFTLTQVNVASNTTITVPFKAGTTTIGNIKYPTSGPQPFNGVPFYKDLYVDPSGVATWYVYLPAGKTGQTTDYNNVVVEDSMSGGQTIVAGSIRLEHATSLYADGSWPAFAEVSKTAHPYTVTATSSSFVFTTAQLAKGGWWRIAYEVNVAKGYVGQLTNTAKATWDGSKTITTKTTEVYADYGGTGSGEFHAVSVGDTVWWDENHNGIQDEAPGHGIPGAVMTLTGPNGPVTDVNGNPVNPITTDANGYYEFVNLPVLAAGQTYKVTVTPPSGYVPTTPHAGSDRAVDSSTGSETSASLTTSGASDMTLDFGFVKGAVSVGDFVWFDSNRNGLQDDGDASALPGVTLTLTGPNGKAVTDLSGTPVAPTTTDATGKYLFSNLPVLPAGQHYTVTVTPPTGYTATTPNAGTDRALDSSTGSAASGDLVIDGAKDLTLDFGFVKGAVSVGDYVWFDTNRNGLQDSGEKGIAGVTLTLTGPDGNPVTDLSGAEVAPTATDSSGKYLFSNLPTLPAGQHYTVTVTPPSGYLATTANAGTDRAVDSSTGSATSGDLVNHGDKDLTLDFGFVKPSVTVGDYVWVDTNRDGLQGSGEKGIAGVTLTLTGPDGKSVTDVNGTVVAPTTTDASGTYLFTNLPTLPAGQHYTVTVTPPAGFIATVPNAGSDRAVDSSTGSATSGDLVNNGDKDLTLDFGFVKPSVTVGDYVWVDTNRDGLQSSGEKGIAGVTLTLTGPDGKPVTDVNGSVVAPTTTDASGTYLFPNLPALPAGQHYTVTVTPPAGYIATIPTTGSDRAIDSSTGSATSGDLVTNGDQDLTLDFGFVKPSVSVGDLVWVDTNRDGLQTAGENGLAGATLTLTGPDGKPVTDVNGAVVAPITTDSTGKYLFENLPALPAGQHYTVTVTPPAGYLATLPGVGSDRAVDSSTGTATSGDLVTNGASDLTLDFGFVKPVVSVGDYVWADTNRDGLQTTGEPGLPGVTVTLTGPDGKPVTDVNGVVVAPKTTDSAGKYLFENLPTLPAGEHYTVTVTPPAGYVATLPTVGADRAVDSSTGSATSGDLVTNGAKDLTLDFGFVKPSVSVGDYVWVDSNKNGLQDAGEPGLAGATLTLTGPDGKPVTDINGNPVAPVTTPASGAYLFSNLPALPAGQHYTVTVTPPAGYGPTAPNAGTDPALDSSTGSATSGDLVNNGDKDLTLDFGFTKIVVSIGDYVWLDTNRDGLQTTGEPGIPGVTVKLLKGGVVVATTTTDTDGYYGFGDLDPSTQYTVQFVPPTGMTVTTKDAGGDSSNSPSSDLTDSDAGADGLVTVTTPANGTNSTAATKADNPGIDLGLVSQINLVLAKTIVTTGPVRNGAELTYTLTPHNDGPVAALAGWSVTDVLPSTMTLVSISGPGYTCSTTDPTKPVCVASAGLAPGADGAVITVVTKVTVDYGSLKNVAYVSPAPGDVPETNPLVVPTLTTDTSTSPTDNDAQATIDVASPVSVGDYVWWDVNRDGLQSADEPAVPGVKVTLQDAEGKVLDTTVTDANGYYAFAGLVPGARYQIVFTAPTGATFTTDNVGSNEAIDSDAPATGKVTFVAPLSGANETAPGQADLPTIDAGLLKLNLSITKKVTSTGPYYASGNVTYSLVPHNDGPVDALSGWSVTEVLPEGAVLIGLSGDGYVCLTNLVCTSSETLAAGADGKPITVIVQIPEGVTGPFKNVAYVSPSPKEITETNPLVVPTISTDTKASPTDNDAEGVVTVSPPQEEGITITIPNTGATIPLTWFLGAIGLLAAGLILVGASRVGARSRKS